ncbi:MAG: hypothetical protein CM1200mP18_15780 [Gammaproteobacteria bacterium]|nr:MAG: hypothetical protein CM1200mP18_15780 [Gammaproteobacteria bacterium]
MNLQGTGGDIVLVSTKKCLHLGLDLGLTVPLRQLHTSSLGSPVRSSQVMTFGEYGRTRCGFFTWGTTLRALGGGWAGSMRSRGLDPAGLEAYYRDRNLLKAQITADTSACCPFFPDTCHPDHWCNATCGWWSTRSHTPFAPLL